MAKPNLIFATMIVVAAGVLALYGSTLLPAKDKADNQVVAPTPTPLTEPLLDFADPVRGDRSAPVTVTLFSDYLCAPCAEADAAAKALVIANPATVRLVWKDLPNESIHGGATKMAMAARCAGDQGAFWEYHDLLVERQVGLTTGTLVPMAAELGLDLDQFQNCLTNETTRPLIVRSIEEATRLRLDVTPYFFIGGRRISGSLTQDQLQGFVDSALAVQAAAGDASAEAAASTPQP